MYFNSGNILPKSGTFLPGHPVYIIKWTYLWGNKQSLQKVNINEKNKRYKRELKIRKNGQIKSLSSNRTTLILLDQYLVNYFEVQI